MSTVDQKAPVAAPGSADLLDAMVQEHLQRDADGAPPEPQAREAASEESAPVLETELPRDVPPPPADLSPDAGNMLQREIEMLLHDSPEEPGADAAAADTGISGAGEATIAAAGVADESKPGPAAKATDVSQAELDVLLARDAGATAGEKLQPVETAAAEPASAPEAAPPVARVAEPEQHTGSGPAIEQSLSQAEGVLAEELEKLVADSNDQPAHSAEAPAPASTLEEQQLSEAEGVLAAELAQLVAESNTHAAETRETEAPRSNQNEPAAPAAPAAPKSSAIVDESASAPPIGAATTQGQPSVPAISPTAAAHAATSATATETAPQAIAPAATAAESALEEAEETPAPIKGGAARRLLEGIALTFAQLLDFPFRWLGDLDKNIIGIAALLLLLGGVALFALSRIHGT